MQSQDTVLAHFVSLYKEIIDLKAKIAASHTLDPSSAEKTKQSYRATARRELEAAALTLKGLGFSSDEVDRQLTTAFGDLLHFTTRGE